MHVFTFSVSHYKPRTCYKKSGSRCGTNRQGHHAEPTNKIQIIVVVLGSTLKGIVAVKPNVCMECAGVRRGQAALGHAGSVASFSGCFQGLVGKAKQLTVSAASANLPAQEAARISERDDSAFKRKVIRESLSLDT